VPGGAVGPEGAKKSREGSYPLLPAPMPASESWRFYHKTFSTSNGEMLALSRLIEDLVEYCLASVSQVFYPPSPPQALY